MEPFLIRHLKGEETGRFPVWGMRQAGRFLPSYRAIKEKNSFWEMVTDPEIAIRVSLLPLEVLPTDGVILFSDILTLPYGMKVPLEMKESVGPVNREPFSKREDFNLFKDFSFERHTPFVGETLRGISKDLSDEVALLGFAGAPWTVASYLVETHPGKRRFEEILNWMYRDPEDLAGSLGILAEATANYLKEQCSCGADVVQVFDTHLSEMPRSFFVDFYRPILNRIFSELTRPVIYYTKHAHHLLNDMTSLDIDVLSVDSLLPLSEVDRRIGSKFSLQGNLNPVLLLGDEKNVRRETRILVNEARELKRPAIMNLGHGIFPDTPVGNVRAFMEEAVAVWD